MTTESRAALRQLIMGFRVTQLIYVAAKLGIADHLVQGAQPPERLAAAVGAEPRALRRLLRALASLGLFAETDDGAFALTPLAEGLRTDAPAKGYSYPAIRAWLRRRGVRTVIPERADQVRQRAHRPGRKPHFDRVAYRRRSAIECTVGALKEARAVATRYEKLAVHYLALVKLSMIRMLVKRLERPRSHADHGSTHPGSRSCPA